MFAAALVLLSLPLLALEDKKKPSRKAIEELSHAVELLQGGRMEEGIERLRALGEAEGQGPVGKKAREILLDHGVGKEVRIILLDRKTFREQLGFPEPKILELAEASIQAVEAKLGTRGARPHFEKRLLEVYFYDSQARYRKDTDQITSAGHFSVKKVNAEERYVSGSIHWFLPKHTVTVKDRSLSMNGVLTHEAAHYLSTVYFGGIVPSPLEEGVATYLESRLNTDYYQYYRETDRERIESNARQGLQAIAKYPDFIAMLDGTRGFGRGDIMIQRWYGLCYAFVDFFENGEIRGRKGSFARLREELVKLRDEQVEKQAGKAKGKEPGLLPRLGARSTLERLAKVMYGVSLEEFHKALTAHIIARYKQR